MILQLCLEERLPAHHSSYMIIKSQYYTPTHYILECSESANKRSSLCGREDLRIDSVPDVSVPMSLSIPWVQRNLNKHQYCWFVHYSRVFVRPPQYLFQILDAGYLLVGKVQLLLMKQLSRGLISNEHMHNADLLQLALLLQLLDHVCSIKCGYVDRQDQE